LEAVLDTVNIQSVRNLIAELKKPNDESGFSLAHSFPALLRVAEDFLGVKSDAGQTFSDKLFADLNARGCELKVGAKT
jgi:hypothetical protein